MERGSKEKVIREIKNYQKAILQDFWEEIQALISDATPLFENGVDEKRFIRTEEGKVTIVQASYCDVVDSKMVQKFKKMLYSIKEEDLEAGLRIAEDFIRSTDEEEDYIKLDGAYYKRLERIGSLPTDYNFAESALKFIEM